MDERLLSGRRWHPWARLALLAGLTVTTTFAVDADAQNKKGPKKEAAAPIPAEPPMTKNPIVLEPTDAKKQSLLAWGMNHKQVAGVYDKILDEDYKPLYQQTSPGVKMKALDAALAEEKSAFRRSRIDFGKIPTGMDATPLKGEYSYMNKESVMSITRKGQTRYLFFIQDKLWKVIDEFKLAEGTFYGKDFQSAVIKLATIYGVPGRVLPPDPDKGRYMPEVDWKDAHNLAIARQRSDTAFAHIIIDAATQANLANLRTNKPAQDDGIDPAVAAAVGKPAAPPPPPETKDKKKK